MLGKINIYCKCRREQTNVVPIICKGRPCVCPLGGNMNTDIKIATRQSYGETLVEIGKENEKLVVLDADLSEATKTSLFKKEFPNRFFDMGIAEQDMMSTAARNGNLWTNTVCKHFCNVCSRTSL